MSTANIEIKRSVTEAKSEAGLAASGGSALEPGETLENLFVDHRAGSGEWANCKGCGNPVFVPQAMGFDADPIVCTCGVLAFEVAAYAVRRRRLPNVPMSESAR